MANNNVFRNIPSVNELLETKTLRDLVDRASHNAIVDEVRAFLDNLRHEVNTRASELEVPSAAEIAERVAKWIRKGESAKLRPVVNATGILLHTGLGRAPLAHAAIESMTTIGENYASLEVDLETGQRSQRLNSVERLLQELTGAEAAAVVNNNAAATLLTLAALAAEREVVVSRGQLIEIGGSYRLPEIMAAGGTVLREVGTTNKTRPADFDAACGEPTAAIMRVHTSNYRIIGFTSQPTLIELVRIARKHDVIMIDDIGSGALHDLSKYGLTDEPIARDSIAAGADIVLFSGDKLIGGPQCGIILGKKCYIQSILSHPLMRALRVGKLTLAALEETLQLHRDEKRAVESLPLMQMLATSQANLQGRAERLAMQLIESACVSTCAAIEGKSQLGGGSVPAQDLPTWCVAIQPHGMAIDDLTARLRKGTPSIFGRVHKDQLLLDLRTVSPDQESLILQAFDAIQVGESMTSD